MGKFVIYAALILIVVLAVLGIVKRIRHGSSCCGEHEPAPKKVRPSDTNKNNYPYLYDLTVDGMHCSNCATRVENSFNKHDGLWAKADIGRKCVEVRSKTQLDEAVLRNAVNEAGYTLISINKN